MLLPPALATGNLDIVPDAMVREVTVDAQGRATGVHYIDKLTRTDRHVTARVVVLAAIGLRDGAHPPQLEERDVSRTALSNSSGLVGKYLMDTVGAGIGGQIPALENMPPHNDDGVTAMHVYMPWWLYKQQPAGQLDFARGYHVEFGGGRSMPGNGTFNFLEGITQGAYGQRTRRRRAATTAASSGSTGAAR